MVLWLTACGVLGDQSERWAAEAGESALLAFVVGRTDRHVPSAPLQLQTAKVYSAAVSDAAGARLWQVREPRAAVVTLPLLASDRQAGVDFKADVVILFEERYCALHATGQVERCEPWQPMRCCEQVWQRSHGAWSAAHPPARQ